MKKAFFLFVIIVLCVNLNAQNQSKINFIVSFPDAKNHYADVEMNIDGINDKYVDLKMPVWTPGSYMVREFSKSVEQFSAQTNSGKDLKFEKITKNTWRVYNNENKAVKIKYKVYAFEISVRTSFVDLSHAFLSGTSIFMYPDNRLKESSTVEIKLANGWDKISTGLTSTGKNKYFAPDFDLLYDSPIEVGNQDIFYFEASGVKHEVAMYGGGNYDKENLKKDMAKIVEELTTIFGENPNKNYTFIVHNYNSGGGGLEHLNSTVLGCIRNDYANEEGYLGFINLVAHEYFHLWNVKRLRPIALGPFNYDQENYTTNLWIAEGFTSYYDNLVMRHAGYFTQERYLENIAADCTGLDNTPGTKIQSVSESSLDAWIKYYRPNENSKNTTVSYYSKGGVIGVCMDLLIINATKGEKSLADVMKAMYETYYKKENRGYTDLEFKTMVEKISGVNMDNFYNKYIYGTEPIPYQEFLSYAGLTLKNLNAEKNDPFLGASTTKRDNKLIITNVLRDGSAWNAGLNVNDEIKSIDDIVVESLDKFIASKKVGDEINVSVIRDGLQKNIKVKLQKNNNVKYVINVDEKASAQQKLVLKKWLKL